jgi:hypothetical protein
VGKATRRDQRSASSDAVADEVAGRAAHVHTALVDAVGSYYGLAACHERLVASADVVCEHVRAVDDAPWEVRERLGLSVVDRALEARARRFGEDRLDPFAPGRLGHGAGAPKRRELRANGERLDAGELSASGPSR